MLKSAEDLIDVARRLSHKQLADLMNISDKLIEENSQRYKDFSTPFNRDNAKQAALAFVGDTYLGLDASSFSAEDFSYAQDHLRILSGLYGLLRPLDLIQAYRLEMKTRLKTAKGKNLLNCASNEYVRVVNPDLLNADIITAVFKQVKDGQVRSHGMMAKRARGMPARYVIQNKIEGLEDLKGFRADGYRFQRKNSDSGIFEFHRKA